MLRLLFQCHQRIHGMLWIDFPRGPAHNLCTRNRPCFLWVHRSSSKDDYRVQISLLAWMETLYLVFDAQLHFSALLLPFVYYTCRPRFTLHLIAIVFISSACPKSTGSSVQSPSHFKQWIPVSTFPHIHDYGRAASSAPTPHRRSASSPLCPLIFQFPNSGYDVSSSILVRRSFQVTLL